MVIGILAHVDAGKTTLSEALLYKTGQIRNLGRVDHQDAYLDNDDQERERGITIFSKQARIETEDISITLLDTPGHVDFSAEMERTLQVLDYALLVISGTDGVQGHTRTLWRLLRHYDIPTFIFVNKMDMDGTDEEAVLTELKTELSDGCVKLYSGEIDYVNAFDGMNTVSSNGQSAQLAGKKDADLYRKNVAENGCSDDIKDENICEELAMCDEALLNEYMENGGLSKDSVRKAICDRKVFPCFFGSALKLTGVDALISGIREYAVEKSYPSEFAARVYKIGRDDRGVRLTYMKILGGGIAVRDKLEYSDLVEKIDQIRKYSGEKYVTCDSAKAGEIVTVTGLSSTYPGQAFGNLGEDNMAILEPVLNYQLILPKEVNPAEFLKNMKLIEEEDPSLYVVWNEEHREIHIQLMGQVQMEVLTRLIKDRFGVVVTFGPGSIVYKETLAKPVEGVGHFEPLRHYAEVHLLLEPLPRGSGLVFAADCSEEQLDKNWQRLVLTHLYEKEHLGVLTGSVITDMKITLKAGRAHQKHTEGGDFRQATYRAVRQGLMQAESVLLEPYYEFRLEIPETAVGRAMTDIERMCGTFALQQTHEAGMAVITGEAPVSTMKDYYKEVVAYSKGTGRLFCNLKGYEVCHNQNEVLKTCGYIAERDLDNPADSVFCAHGSGFVVGWQEVPEYMHLESILKEKRKDEMQPQKAAARSVSDEWIGTEEIDEILRQTYYANKRDKSMPRTGTKKRTITRVDTLPKTSGMTVRSYDQPAQKEYLLVDGYNIIFAWQELKELAAVNIDSARGRLLDILCNYQGSRQCELIVVFDAYRVKGHVTEFTDYYNIHVVYTKEAETADAYIEKFAHENGRKYKVTVATSDGLEQVIIRGQGCLLMSAREFEAEVKAREQHIRENYLTP